MHSQKRPTLVSAPTVSQRANSKVATWQKGQLLIVMVAGVMFQMVPIIVFEVLFCRVTLKSLLQIKASRNLSLLYGATIIFVAFILVRSIYRTIELLQLAIDESGLTSESPRSANFHHRLRWRRSDVSGNMTYFVLEACLLRCKVWIATIRDHESISSKPRDR